MLNKSRFDRILKEMDNKNIPQLLITDAYAIYYLTGKMIDSGERMLVLYINKDRVAKLVINELFPQEEDLGVELVWYNDVNDGVEILSKHIAKYETIGVDKVWQSGFLLRLQELLPEKNYKNGSMIVDKVRRIKDKEEQELMRQSSALNDKVMLDLIPWVSKGLMNLNLAKK